MLPAVNFHLWRPCNYRCRFCFARFAEVPAALDRTATVQIVDALADHGCDKLTFVGGEPTLCPFLGDAVERAAARGITTSVVSNGARLAALIDRHGDALDWIGLSVDSGDEAVNVQLGRGRGDHVARTIALAAHARSRGISIKLNTVVTALNRDEDFGPIVRQLQPERWKVFQVLPIAGQNDGEGQLEGLEITAAALVAYAERHRAQGLAPIIEDNDAMTGSYVMIDPMGRFFDNVDGRLSYGPPILEVGVERALAGVRWERERLVARGGLYPWRRRR